MKIPNPSTLLTLMGVACLTAWPAAVQGEVLFLNGGYAETCSVAAHNVQSVNRLELTGSRLAVPPIDICTRAITEGGLVGRELAGSYVNRGVLLFAKGRLDEAMADFDRAVSISPTLADAHVNRGYTLVAQSRWSDSLSAFDRGIELGPSDPARVFYNRGVAHEESGNIREAYYDYLQASELAPEWEEPLRELERFEVR